MRKKNKFVAVLVIVSFLVTFLAGCSADELTVIGALTKSASINSMESKTSITLRFEASGFPKRESQDISFLAAILNGMKIDLNQKLSRNADRTISKSQVDGIFDIGGVSSGFSVWADSDITGEKAVVKEIVRIPSVATLALPYQFRGKQYIMFDFANMPEGGEKFAVDYKKALEFNNSFTTKLINFIKEYAKQFDPGFNFITYKGGKSVNGEYLSFYEMKLDDSSFKALLKYTINNFMQNKMAMEFIKDFIISAVKIYSEDNGASVNLTSIQAEMMIKMLEDSIAENLEMVNKVFDAIKDVKIVGEKGITISYGINNDGYVASESGSMDFKIDMKEIVTALEKLSEGVVPARAAGTIAFGIDYSTEISNINKDVKIVLPELNEKNSFSYTELYEVLNPTIIECYGYAPYSYDENKPVNIEIDGKLLGVGLDAKVKDYTILVPVRAVSEALGAKVSTNAKNQTVTVHKDDTKIVFKANSNEAEVNGRKYSLAEPMTSINKKNYVPVSMLTDYLAAGTKWNKKTNTLIIYSNYNDMEMWE
ncbi:MAG: copper amine oxidase N-terminal domain-containing protein [Clostridia bacterium]|nr:copper amine oxidase N-terminal domain-containing protein [Clostridia bacterium]